MDKTTTELYPLKLQAIYKPTIWGGQQIADYKPGLSKDERIGESWEVYDDCLIANGALAGRSLADAVKLWGRALVGTASPSDEFFPLMTKFIDANDNLSVQLHPNDAQAQEIEGYFCGKTEMWYVLRTTPEAQVALGTVGSDDPEVVREQIAAGTLEEMLHFLPVSAGDVVYIPAGRVHALGKGTLVYEVLQRSEHTYRLYDWNRLDSNGKGRELHVDKAMQVIRFEQPAPGKLKPLRIGSENLRADVLKVSPFFAVTVVEAKTNLHTRVDGSSFAIYTVLDGSGTLTWTKLGEIVHFTNDPQDRSNRELDLVTGDTVIIPAGLSNHSIAANDSIKVIVTTLAPTAEVIESQIRPQLLAAGYNEAQVAGVLAADMG